VLVGIGQAWGEDRVFFFGEAGAQRSLPTGWTDAATPDPFVACAGGRSALKVGDLLALGELIDGLGRSSGRRRVSGEFRRPRKGNYAAAHRLRAAVSSRDQPYVSHIGQIGDVADRSVRP
jgi:Family of unknown function (DUF5372)